MPIEKKNINLLGYKHDRSAYYGTTADEIVKLINNYSDQESLSIFFGYFDRVYQLPESVTKQSLRQYIAHSYLYKKGQFHSKLFIKSIPEFFLRYAALIYGLFFVRIKRKTRKYKIIVDGISSLVELKRFEKLLNLFGKDSVFLIAKDINLEKECINCHIYNKKLFQGIKLIDLLKSILSEILVGVWLVLIVSIKTKVNLYPVALKIIHSYLSYKAIFEINRADFIIQEKHYETDPVKNYLFKKFGGVASTSIQKNIIQADTMFFYMDLDILFSLGRARADYNRVFKFGGRVDLVEPVGSLFMEYYWFKNKPACETEYDVVVLGINTSNAYERKDSFNEFMDDYYALYRWIAKLSTDNPEYKIALIHHASAGKDAIEEGILKGSNIRVIDKNKNSYEIAFSSKCAVTYGSTMGFELNAHNLPTFFVDPGYRCSFIPEKGVDYIDQMKVHSYEDLSAKVSEVIDTDSVNNLANIDPDMWCLESSEVSDRIFSILTSGKVR